MPPSLRQAWLRCCTFVRSRRADAEAAREVAAHLVLLEDEYRRAGLSPADASVAARRSLGGVDQTMERHRDARSLPWLEDLRRDAAYAMRGFVKAPTFAVASIATLALGIGAASAVFAIAHALLIKPLSYAQEPARLVRLIGHSRDAASPAGPPVRREVGFSIDEANELRTRTRALDVVGIVAPTVMGLSGVDGAGNLAGARVSASVLDLLNAAPLLGRRLTAADEATGADVVLLSYGTWQRLFGGDLAILGRTLVFEVVLGARRAIPYQVVGVMPPEFRFPAAQTAFWMLPRANQSLPFRGRLLARLASGWTVASAASEVGETTRALRQLGPDIRFELVREQDELVAGVRPAVLALAVAVAVLLGIASLNVAALAHARALARRRELAVRAAVGASRSRLVRQCLTEIVILGTLGGAAGIALAYAALSAFRTLATSLARIDLAGPPAFPRLDEVAIDGTVVAVSALTTVVAGLAVGLTAAVRASRADPQQAVRPHERTRGAAQRGRRALVVAQIAGAMTLLVGALLLTSTLGHLLSTETGYATNSRLTFQVALPSSAYPDSRLRAFAEDLVTRLDGLPAIATAAYANQLPMVQLRDSGGGLWTSPDAARGPAPGGGADARYVSRRYLETMGVAVRRGRGFADSDGAGQPRVLLVNETLARQQFSSADPIGTQVYIGRDVVPWTIVGVVGDVRQFGLQRAPEPQFFVDLRQWVPGGTPLFPAGAYFVAATRASPDEVVPEVRALVKSLDPEGALFNVASMDAIVSSAVTQPRLFAALMTTFATIGALMAAMGIYGVLAFLVHERRQEFGVRMALGAARRDVLALVLRQGAILVAVGLGLGTAGAFALSRSIESLLYGVSARDPQAFVLAAALFAAVAAVAMWVPAHRATRVDPLEVMRCE